MSGVTIAWIRHAATPGNEEKRMLGTTDESLSQEGIRTLRKMARRGDYPPAQLVLTGPSARCRQTAEIVYPDRSMHRVVPEWTEIDFGDFEYRNYRELNGNPVYQAWIDSGGTAPFPHGEDPETFQRRCRAGWERAKKLLADAMSGRRETLTAAAVVSGGNIMAVLSSECGGSFFDYQVANGCGYLCRFRPEEGRLEVIRKIGEEKIC